MKGQWYPGNMARAMRQLREDLRVIDLVVELLDARIPDSSRNPYLSRLLGGRQRLVLLHKADRGEPEINTRWLSYFKRQGLSALAFSVYTPRSLQELYRYLRGQVRKKHTAARLRRPLRLMVVGIPNVGKSTLINMLVKKAATRTGNRPGITRGRQWVRLLPGVELLDTPGVLWPNLSGDTAIPLAVVGALPPGRLEVQKLALWLLDVYRERGKVAQLLHRYAGLREGEAPENMLERIGAAHGCLLPGGEIDRERAAALLLRDFQNGSLGRLSLEHPP